MASIDPSSATRHRSAIIHDPADPEIIAGNQVSGDALFSSCRTWRYRLSRHWNGGKGTVMWLMLNPSTADAVRVDPTVRRSVTFSMNWGFNVCVVGNVFALRATSPQFLYDHRDPIGPDTDEHLTAMADHADRIVLGWGNHAAVGQRYRTVAQILYPYRKKCVHLGTTASGMPKHPLYLSGTTIPQSAEAVLKALLS